MFVIPSWATHEHLNDEADPALLFSVHDTPLLQTLGKYRREPHDSPDGRQRVTGEFSAGAGSCPHVPTLEGKTGEGP
jgi:hypothetical protein